MRAQKLSVAKSIAFGAAAIIPGLLMGGSTLAQEASPAAGPSNGYPVAIHQGHCSDLTAQPSFQFDNNAVAIGSDEDTPDMVGNATAAPMVMTTSQTVDTKLDDLADDVSAVAIHKNSQDYDTIVACGNIVGVKEDGKLVIALNSEDDNTVVGIATLDEDTSGILGLGKDQINVTVYIFDTQNTGMATPAS